MPNKVKKDYDTMKKFNYSTIKKMLTTKKMSERSAIQARTKRTNSPYGSSMVENEQKN